MIAVYYKWMAPDGQVFVSVDQDSWLPVSRDPGEGDYCAVARLFVGGEILPMTLATRWFWTRYDGFQWDDIETVRSEVTRYDMEEAAIPKVSE